MKKKKRSAGVSKSKSKKDIAKKSPQGTRLPVRYAFPYLPAADQALMHYIRNVEHYPILTDEEEKELIESFRSHKNMAAARELIQSNLRLVVKITLEYRNAVQNLMDVIQEGNIGLIKAIQMYDPEKGTRLGYYAAWWIRSYILKYIMDNFRLVRIGTSQAQKKLFFNLVREKQRMEALGYQAGETRKLLSQTFDVSEQQIEEMTTRLGSSEASLEAPVGEGEGDNLVLIDMIDDKQPSALDRIIAKEKQAMLVDRLKELTKRLNVKEQAILRERLLAEIPKTLEELGGEFGVTKERMRQLQNRLIEKLRNELRDIGVEIGSAS